MSQRGIGTTGEDVSNCMSERLTFAHGLEADLCALGGLVDVHRQLALRTQHLCRHPACAGKHVQLHCSLLYVHRDHKDY